MIDYIEHHIIDYCNLNCAGCSHFSPLAEPWMESSKQFIYDFYELAKKTNHQIGTIRLMGGEPLLHPLVGWFCEAARNLFPASEIQLVTNGILWFDSLAEVLNKNRITLCISNYHLKLPLDHIKSLVNQVRIDNKGELYNICLEYCEGDQNINFNSCDLHQHRWFYFQNGYLYHCCIGANIHNFNRYFNKDFPEPQGISVHDHNLDAIEKFLAEPNPLCCHCNTQKRQQTYCKFAVSKKEEKEWICP